MKICVSGSGDKETDRVMKMAYEVGAEIAKQKCILLTGGCAGVPYEAVKGAVKENGETVAYSPAKNFNEHTQLYRFPTEGFSKIVYTGKGIPGRNQILVEHSDGVLLIAGRIGTLNEFTLAYVLGKPIGVLEGSGGITDFIKDIEKICVSFGSTIFYDNNPKELVRKLRSVM